MSKKLSPEEKAARAAENKAKQDAERDEYVAKLVANWPEPTFEQKVRISYLLFGTPESVGPRHPSEYELDQRKKMYEREAALKEAKKLAESLTACDVCNLQPDVHHIRRANGIDVHEWTPGRAQKLMKPEALSAEVDG